ncbi:hypothetical protein DN752_19650 [Echinicola strongylocentroti]|uniref:Phage tail tape measure protein domain-containing protein n=1 Tax=Echinicola strongylocentroti TaxID=1795355 RepID=A0A2Z4IN60_9BACT|nr:phage tail tape measure protein [Echinicola strongylocentroti]AWW32177.1 hypothetical protein DN752_19650 [Echinicola strongylocentroti]
MALANVNLKFGVNLKDFSSKLQNMEKNVEKFGNNLKKVGGGLTKGLTAPIIGATAAATALAIKVGGVADRLLDLEQITGISTDSLQEYQYVANQAGVSTESVSAAMEGLTRRIMDLEEPSNKAGIALKELGVYVRNANGELRTGDQIMDDVINSLADMQNPVERNAYGAKIFGGAWKDMAPILSMGTKGIKAAREEAHQLGIVMSKDSLNGSNAFRMSVDRLKATFDGLLNQMGASFAPMLNDTIIPLIDDFVVPAFRAFAGFIKRITDGFNSLSPVVKNIALVVTGLVAAVGPLLTGLGVLTMTVIPALKTGIMVLTTVFSPLVLKIAAVVAIVGGLALVVKGVIDSWETVKTYFSQLWDRIKLFFIKGVAGTLEVFNKFTSAIGLDFSDTIDGLREKSKGMQEALDAQPVVTLGDVFSEVGSSIMNTFTSLKDSVTSSMSTTREEVTKTTEAVKGLGGAVQSLTSSGLGDISTSSNRKSMLPEIDVDAFNEKLDSIKLAVVNKGHQINDAIVSFNQQASSIITGSIGSTFSQIGTAIGEGFVSGENAFKAAGKSLLGSLAGIMSQIGELMIEYGALAIVKAKLDASMAIPGAGFITGPLAIAAGIALISASAAVGAVASGKSSGSSGGGALGEATNVSGMRAMGGTVSAGNSYIVGERGPEIWKASGHGKIIPNNKLGGLNGPLLIRIVGEFIQRGTDMVATIDQTKMVYGRTT